MPEQLLPFLLASFLIELTPGPNMTWLVIVTLSKGRRDGLFAVLGVALGLGLLGVAGAFGASELVQSSPYVYESLRWAGVLFLIYLAWDGYRGDGDGQDLAPGQYFRRGFISNLLNPKAALFYVTVLPAFLGGTMQVRRETLLLTAGYVAVATVVHTAIVLFAAQLQPLLMVPRRARVTRRILSGLLLAVAIWFAWATRR